MKIISLKTIEREHSMKGLYDSYDVTIQYDNNDELDIILELCESLKIPKREIIIENSGAVRLEGVEQPQVQKIRNTIKDKKHKSNFFKKLFNLRPGYKYGKELNPSIKSEKEKILEEKISTQSMIIREKDFSIIKSAVEFESLGKGLNDEQKNLIIDVLSNSKDYKDLNLKIRELISVIHVPSVEQELLDELGIKLEWYHQKIIDVVKQVIYYDIPQDYKPVILHPCLRFYDDDYYEVDKIPIQIQIAKRVNLILQFSTDFLPSDLSKIIIDNISNTKNIKTCLDETKLAMMQKKVEKDNSNEENRIETGDN